MLTHPHNHALASLPLAACVSACLRAESTCEWLRMLLPPRLHSYPLCLRHGSAGRAYDGCGRSVLTGTVSLISALPTPAASCPLLANRSVPPASSPCPMRCRIPPLRSRSGVCACHPRRRPSRPRRPSAVVRSAARHCLHNAARTRREIKIVDKDLKDSEIDKIIESGKAQDVIKEALISDNLKNVVQVIEERHLDILKLEHQVWHAPHRTHDAHRVAVRADEGL